MIILIYWLVIKCFCNHPNFGLIMKINLNFVFNLMVFKILFKPYEPLHTLFTTYLQPDYDELGIAVLIRRDLFIQIFSFDICLILGNTLNYSYWLEIIKPESKRRARTQLRAAPAARWVSPAASYVNADAANSANPALNTFTSPTNFSKACYYLESGLLRLSPTFHTHCLLYFLQRKGVTLKYHKI